jgi:hypothetical protein
VENKKYLCIKCLYKHGLKEPCVTGLPEITEPTEKDCAGGMKLLKFPSKKEEPIKEAAAEEKKEEGFADYKTIFKNIEKEHGDDIKSVLVLMRNHDGTLHWWGNVGTAPHMVLMMESIKGAIIENEDICTESMNAEEPEDPEPLSTA